MLLDGRHVYTTVDGQRNLSPRPGVHGKGEWESTSVILAGQRFTITAIPAKHVRGGQCLGFVIECESLARTGDLPNAVYFTGDTVLTEELLKIKEKWHISIMLVSLGNAHVPGPEGLLQVTMGARDASLLAHKLDADTVTPQHFDSWAHFTESSAEARRIWEEMGLLTFKFCTPGILTRLS
ncbi:hypothetical protein FA10DRAFT_130964 [Acaromyces ingoldii]|uniref:Metallo-beta-lactamase domain-containing protein n=1 Tax=Acaromyces ingoldii TaxID=215250 RepID=A0A316YHC1_9BASI|nr:hypothetical protein FA10DRAFT_130964 [Acaromyces ingoldii]PWN88827.1 hypothetical protein FA10DRAFT_130964 [Acaromyces ingoldii]